MFKFLRPKKRKVSVTEPSDPELLKIWQEQRQHFFPKRPDLDDYTVVWSKRAQKRTLASCQLERRRVVVARELNYDQHQVWLKPLLHHEMCHAYLGKQVGYTKQGRAWHGPAFKQQERRHPLQPIFDQWVKQGGWERAVRSDRAKRAHQQRKSTT